VINGVSYDTDAYYFQLYMSKQNLLNSGDMLTNAQLQTKPDGQVTLEALLKDQVESSLKVSAAVVNIAKDNGIVLDKKDLNDIKNKKTDFISNIGGTKAFNDFLKNHRTSEAALDDYFHTDALLEKIERELYAPGKSFDLTDEEKSKAQSEYKESYAKISYILFSLTDSKGKPLSETLATQKRTLATEVYTKTRNTDFVALIKEYSDDASTQQSSNYETYILKGSGSQKFSDAIFTVPDGKVSEPHEFENGLIIVKRLPLDEEKLEGYYSASRTVKMNNDISNLSKGYSPDYKKAYDALVIR
jgi:parvulin-like peptidyl-prolyl isomerase